MRALVFVLVCATLLRSGIAGGVIEGKVPLGPGASAPAVSSGRYQIKASSAIASAQPPVAIVYLEGSFSAQAASTNTQRIMGQKQFQFTESVLPVQKGSAVEFPNLDDDYHNVFSYSKPKRFDLGRYKKEEKAPSITFDQPGLVKLYCEIHEHMRANILVLDTPYFTRTETNGAFRLNDIPAGQYTLKAWLDEKNILSQPVQVKEGETALVSFTP